MEQVQINQALAMVRGLFPAVTDEQLAVVGERIRRCEYVRVVRVIKDHAATHQWLHMPALAEGLRADAARAQRPDPPPAQFRGEQQILDHAERCRQAVLCSGAGPAAIELVLKQIESDAQIALRGVRGSQLSVRSC